MFDISDNYLNSSYLITIDDDYVSLMVAYPGDDIDVIECSTGYEPIRFSHYDDAADIAEALSAVLPDKVITLVLEEQLEDDDTYHTVLSVWYGSKDYL